MRNHLTTTRYARLTAFVHKAAAGAILLGLSYQVDALPSVASFHSGLRDSITETVDAAFSRSTAYQYDAARRLVREELTQAVGPGRITSWVYDDVGNRSSQTIDGATLSYTYDANDRLLSESDGTSHAYDNMGNLLRTQNGADIQRYSWDSSNRLIEHTASNGDRTKFGYDVSGIRTDKTTQFGQPSAQRTAFLIDYLQAYAQVLEEATGPAISAPLFDVAYIHGDDLIAQVRGPATNYLHYDGLGSTRLLSDGSGLVSDRYAYTAYGELDASGSSGATDNVYRYTGEQFDAELGQYYLRARYMDPARGRFMGMDSFRGYQSDPISQNKYLYANTNPALNIDPTGLTSLSQISVSQSIVGTLATAARISSTAINAFEKIDNVITLIQISQGAGSAMQLMRQFSSANGVSEHGFVKAMKDIDEASIVLAKNFGWILSQMALPPKEIQIRQFLSNPRNKLLIYGPTPYLRATPWLPPGTRIHVGKLRLSKSVRDVELELGRGSGQGGRIVGVGHSYGTQRNQGLQWWRMDWHSPHGAGTNDRIDGAYHFHTLTAP